jgi:hypothetical protein
MIQVEASPPALATNSFTAIALVLNGRSSSLAILRKKTSVEEMPVRGTLVRG